MSLPWVKLHTTLVDNTTYRRFSPEAKLTFLTSLMIAGKENRGGRLETSLGPITAGEIADATRLAPKRQREALEELLSAQFLSQDLTGTFVVERFQEKTADLSTIRTRRLRERRAVQERLASDDGTILERSGNAPDRRKEREELYASLRSAAVGTVPGTFLPRQVSGLKALARLFIPRFANTHDAAKVELQVPYYVDTLKVMAARGATIEQAWSAFEQCWGVDEKPLFGAKCKRALQGYLDLSSRPGPSPSPQARETEDLVARARRNVERGKSAS